MRKKGARTTVLVAAEPKEERFVVTWRRSLSTAQGIALALGAIFVAAALQWQLDLPLLDNLIPGSALMGLVSPLLFLLCAVLLWLLSNAQRRGAGPGGWWLPVLSALLVLVPGLFMLEYLFDVNLGLSFARAGMTASAVNPSPGRLSPNAALGFVCAGLAALLASRPLTKRTELVYMALISTVSLVGLAGLVGRLLGLELLYHVGQFNRMLPATALGLTVMGAGLWTLHERQRERATQHLHQHERRIRRRSLTVLVIATLSGGLAGFVVMRDTFEESVTSGMLTIATTNASSIAYALQASLQLTNAEATSPSTVEALARLNRQPKDAGALAALHRISGGFMAAGLTGTRFLDAKGQTLVSVGTLVGDSAQARNALENAGPATYLGWADGYLLYTENIIMDGPRVIGKVITEQRMVIIDRLLSGMRAINVSADALLCGRADDQAVCAPTLLYAKPFTLPMYKPNGEINLPINRALIGEHGAAVANDLRGITVMAGYAPIGSYGLGLVAKTDVDTLFAPLKQRAKLLLLALLSLLALGTYLQRSQVRPLIRQILTEQRRTQAILSNANDAFVMLQPDGTVGDWNAAAERMFGWSHAEAVGQPMATLIIPQAQRQAHFHGFAHFVRTGTGPILNRSIELTALHRDGHEFPIELSVAALNGPNGFFAHAFARDISDRKHSEQALAESERLIRGVTDNLPILVAYIDAQEHYRFMNATFQTWMGIDLSQAIGRPSQEVLGPERYAERAPYFKRALAGERVEVDLNLESPLQVDVQSLRNIYVPDVLSNGQVVGLYALSMDVTALKRVQQQLSALARFDTLTGLPNRHQFNEKIAEALARAKRSGNALALMFLDIDRFKAINDTQGHAAGDGVLQEFARRLQLAARKTDCVARLAGDEFVMVLEGLHNASEAERVASQIITLMAAEFALKDVRLRVSTSIGIAFHPVAASTTPADLLARADSALYQAKAAGRNVYRTAEPV